jgi:hypothetical protein
LAIVFPSVINDSPHTSFPPEQEISLFTEREKLAEYYQKNTKITKDHFSLVQGQIPVIIDATYSVAGVSMPRRGLYYFALTAVVDQNSPPKVDLLDLYFVTGLDINSDPRKEVDDLMSQRQVRTH